MLVSSKEILLKAKIQNYAVPHFNFNGLESARYILEACEKNASPVILAVSESAVEYIGGYKMCYDIVADLVANLKLTIPVVLHLDHGKNVVSCKRAIDAGFTSVMIDASAHSLEENIEMTKEVVEYAKAKGVTVEAELGKIVTYVGEDILEHQYTTKEDAFTLVSKTKIDVLAPAIGNVHGSYDKKVPLKISVLDDIKERVDIPFALHGGTGISDEDIKELINRGVCKININTEIQVAWANAVKEFIKENPNVYDPRKIIASGKEAIYKVVTEKINLFGSNNKI